MSTWHSDTIQAFKTTSTDSLLYIRDDAYKAAKAGDSFGNPKAVQYWDEFHYASQELRRRGVTAVSFNKGA